jgi:hypothetical protein
MSNDTSAAALLPWGQPKRDDICTTKISPAAALLPWGQPKLVQTRRHKLP